VSELRKAALMFIVLMAFGIVALAYEWLSETVGRRWLTLIAVSTVVLILLAGYAAFAADNNPFSGARGIRVTMVREKVKTVGASTRHHRRPAIAPSPRVATHPSPE